MLSRWATRARKRALLAAGNLWIEKFLPKHFTHAGGREYGYEDRLTFYYRNYDRTLRSRETVHRHKKYKSSRGSRPPLVMKGRTRDEAKGSARAKVYGSQVRVSMNVPYYIRANTAIDLEGELTRVSQGEADEMGDVYVDAANTVWGRFHKRYVVG